jgi:hypothetical protein
LDFGERDAQKDFHWTLPIRNRGPASVQVVALRTSCACSSVDPKSFELQPGEEISVTLRLDLTASRPGSEPLRAFAVDLAAVAKPGPVNVANWRLAGRVRDVVVYSPPELAFRDSLVRGALFSPRTVRLTFSKGVRNVAVECPGWLGTATIRTLEDNHYEVALAPSLELPLGPFEGEISILALSESGEPLTLPPLPVHGQICGPIVASPTVLLLGAVKQGERIQGEVRIRSRLSKPIQVLSTSSSHSDTEVSLESVREGQTEFLYRIERIQLELGLIQAPIDFVVVGDSPDDEPSRVTVQVLTQGIR